MSSSGDKPGDAADQSLTAPAESVDELTFSMRPIDAAPAPRKTSVSARARPSADNDGQTLTTFDWLDTIVADAVLASDRAAHQAAAGSGRADSAEWLATDFVAGSGLDRTAMLGQVVLGYSPLIDRHRGVIATRLTVVPVRADAALNAGDLLDAVAHVWPQGAGTVALNVSSESLLNDLLRARPDPNLMIEVPAFLAADPANVEALRELAGRGSVLLLKGRPTRELPRAVLPCFKWSIIDFADDRRLASAPSPSGAARSIPHIQSGVRTMAQLRLSFERGAIAVIGWPMHEPIASHFEARPDLHVVLEMISRIDRNEAAEAIQRPLLRDPLLAYELMRHVNAAVAGPLQLETASFQHAVSILGHQHLRRWLAAILERTGDELSVRPVNFAALRRGLLMRLLSSPGSGSQTRGELFMCGVFSLLDRIYARPIGELLASLSIADRVAQALVEARGPFHPLLELARAIESEVPHEIRSAANAAFVNPSEINRALLRTLRIAADLEGGTAPR